MYEVDDIVCYADAILCISGIFERVKLWTTIYACIIVDNFILFILLLFIV
jgi:hypothetical protein